MGERLGGEGVSRIGWAAALVLTRYWDLVSGLAVWGAVYLALFPALTWGPLARHAAPDLAACTQRGWLSLLLVHNFTPQVPFFFSKPNRHIQSYKFMDIQLKKGSH